MSGCPQLGRSGKGVMLMREVAGGEGGGVGGMLKINCSDVSITVNTLKTTATLSCTLYMGERYGM